MSHSQRLFRTGLAAACLALLGTTGLARGAEPLKEFRVGVISSKADKMLKEYAPLAEYVAARLKRFGVERGAVYVAKDINAMMREIRAGSVSIVFESAYASVELQREGMMPQVLAWRKGVRAYHTLFFTRRDSAVRTLDDLRGKSVVFEDPHSTSAYAIPKAELLRRGMRVVQAGDASNGPDAVTALFAAEELNQAFWVIRRRADAGAINNNDWEELPPVIKADLRIIHETKDLPRYIGSFHPACPAEVRQAAVAALLEMDRSEAGRRALEQASHIRRIEALTDDDRAALDYVKELVSIIE